MNKTHLKKVENYIDKQPDSWNEWRIRRSVNIPIDDVRECLKKLGYTPPGPGTLSPTSQPASKKNKSKRKSKKKKGFTLEELRSKFDVKLKIKQAIGKMPNGVLYSEEELREEVGSTRNQKWFRAIKSADIKWYALQFENKEIGYGPRKDILKFHAKLPDSKLLRKE